MIWIEDISVLFDIDKLKYYIPGPNLTWEEGANALVRFIIYLSVILFIFKGNPINLIAMPLIMMGIQYYLYKEGKLEGIMYKIFNSRMEKADSESKIRENYGDMAANNDNNLTNKLGNFMNIKNPMDMEKEWETEKCDRLWNKDWDESGKPCKPKDELGPVFDGETYEENGPRPDLPLDDAEMNQQPFNGKEITCKPSTRENPFGNALPYDTIERQTNKVCPDEYKKDGNFYKGLYNNIDDLFDRNNSQRQYTTNPSSTRTNDIEAFIQFAYNTPYSTQS